MKLITGDRQKLLSQIQERIDRLQPDAKIALAYNNDTRYLDLSVKTVIQVMNDSNNVIGSAFDFTIKTENFDESEIDLAILGIGYKGQIGFNEVGTQYNTFTHEQKLTASTIEEFSQFGDIGLSGITFGIKTLVSSKEIIVFACGEKRADAVFGMMYGRNDSTVPAAFLQIPQNVTVYADNDAASKL